jgi:hypothetical protein
MIVRYFLKTDDKGKPTAVIRLVIDNEKKTLLDQFWNPANSVWERGAYGMGAIAIGLPDVTEVDKTFILQFFPECPVDKDLA